MKGDLMSWNRNFSLIPDGHTVLSDGPYYINLLQPRAKSNRIGLIIPSFIVRAYKKFRRSNKRIEISLSSAGSLNRVAIRESSSRRKAVVAHKESEWPRKLKVCGSEGWGKTKIFGGPDPGIAVINERALRQPLEYWGSFIARWNDAEATELSPTDWSAPV